MDRVRCEDDGTFELAIVAPAQIRLLIEHGAMDRWYGGDSFDEAAFFAVEPGDHVTSIEVVESVFELLLSGPGPFINHDAELFIRHEDGRVFDVSGRYQSRIEIHNLEPGRYAIGVRSNCFDQVWQEQWFDGAASQADAILVDLAPGEYRRLDMMLVAGGRIAGDLLEASGERPNLVYCRLHDNGGEALCADAARVYDGEFDFSGLADGSYLLSARISGQEDWWYPGTLEREQATVIEIVDQAEITNFLWSLPESRKGVLR